MNWMRRGYGIRSEVGFLNYKMWYWWKYERRRKFWTWLGMHAPAPLVYWCGIRLWAYITSKPPHDKGHPDSVPFSTALQEWDKENMGGTG